MDELEDYQRSNHDDFATSKELQDRKFTGYRMNSVTDTAEIWVLGVLKKEISSFMLQLNPRAVNQAMQEVFQFEDEPEVMTEEAVATYLERVLKH